jgi:oligoendopeptidase F
MQTVWNLELLKTSDDQLAEVEKISADFCQKWQGRSDYLTNPKILREALDEFDNIQKKYGVTGDLGYYYQLRHFQNQLDTEIKARLNQIEDLGIKLHNQNQFFLLNISKIPKELQKSFVTSAELSDYKHFLERQFAAGQYTLSDPEEKILNLKSQPSHSAWVSMTSTFLSKESVSESLSKLSDPNKSVRDEAAEKLNNIFDKYSEVAEHEINAILHDKKTSDELRGFGRPDQARHLSDDMESETIDAMLAAVESRFDLVHQIYKLKAKFLGVDKLKYHERFVPYGDYHAEFDFKQAVDLVSGVFVDLDSRFADVFDRLINSGQVDVYPAKGKRGGAFCAIDLPSQPVYILLNYTNRLTDVQTLAHEMGHAINDELMKSQKKALNFGTTLATAEVASTFTEDFVVQKLISNASEKEKLALMVHKLDDDIGSIFRQVACYRFEQELHREYWARGYLSKTEIGNIFSKHMSSYMGEFVEQSKGSENWWVYWSHIRSFFYVYSYASGLLISKALQSKVREDPKFIEQIKWFLSQGIGDSPKNLFFTLGIDITDRDFWLCGISEVEKLYEEVKLLV